MSVLAPEDRAALVELEPVIRRVAALDARAVVRVRLTGVSATVLARLPFGVLVSRTVHLEETVAPHRGDVDVTVGAADALDWIEGARSDEPDRRDTEWRGGTPPATGWRRLETIGDDVIRGLVRQGALAVKAAADREGVPGAQPRSDVADALLDSVVLTVDDPTGAPAEVTLRTISALTRMGFLPRGGAAVIDVAGRWTRVAGAYGSVFAERPGAGLTLR